EPLFSGLPPTLRTCCLSSAAKAARSWAMLLNSDFKSLDLTLAAACLSPSSPSLQVLINSLSTSTALSDITTPLSLIWVNSSSTCGRPFPDTHLPATHLIGWTARYVPHSSRLRAGLTASRAYEKCTVGFSGER